MYSAPMRHHDASQPWIEYPLYVSLKEEVYDFLLIPVVDGVPKLRFS